MQSKKSKDYPDWARWLAQDADGAWWVYEVEPLPFHKGWYENEVGLNQKIDQPNIVKNWQDSLRPITLRTKIKKSEL